MILDYCIENALKRLPFQRSERLCYVEASPSRPLRTYIFSLQQYVPDPQHPIYLEARKNWDGDEDILRGWGQLKVFKEIFRLLHAFPLWRDSCRQISYLVSAIEAWRRGWSSDRVWKKGADGGLLERQIKQSKQIRQTDQIERTEQPGYTRQTVQTKQTASIDQAKDIIDLTKGPRVPLDIEPPKWLYSWDEYLSPKPTYEYVNAYMRERYPPERCPCPNSAYFCRLSLASG
jgi:hypothetical protein